MRKIWEFIEGLSAVTIGMIVICGIPIIFWGLLPIWLSVTIFLITFGVYLFQEGRKYAEEEFKRDTYQEDIDLIRSVTDSSYKGEKEYVGEFKDGKKHGQGTCIWNNGDKYIGEFKDDRANGQGKGIFSDGSSYEGGWKNDLYHGHGTETFSDGSSYEGGWKKGKHHGQGTCIWNNGDKYVGEWEDAKQHGQGTFILDKGPKYEGEFKYGQKTIGIMTYSNGEKYLVEFDRDGLEVKRTKCDKNGNIIKKKGKKGKK